MELPAMMTAAVVEEFDGPLVVQSRPLPVLESGEVLVQVEACGLCRTDIHAAHGDWPVKPRLPLIPGHGAVGKVVDQPAAAASTASRVRRRCAADVATRATTSTGASLTT
jgi:D-arabinose 1-dehydrogenase-like Zn-dependent alcohol dehydrogenase